MRPQMAFAKNVGGFDVSDDDMRQACQGKLFTRFYGDFESD